MVVVHHLYHPRLLVFYRRVVVPTVTRRSCLSACAGPSSCDACYSYLVVRIYLIFRRHNIVHVSTSQNVTEAGPAQPLPNMHLLSSTRSVGIKTGRVFMALTSKHDEDK
jgi:hypothetical protein